jgi:hypothetical protein
MMLYESDEHRMTGFKSKEELTNKLADLRGKLEPVFAPDTALGSYNDNVPSTGHCAAVAVIVHGELGGVFVSATVSGISHWFNRFIVNGTIVDADITGDQFGYSKIRIAEKDKLFDGTRERKSSDINEETRRRSELLAKRAHLEDPMKIGKSASA